MDRPAAGEPAGQAVIAGPGLESGPQCTLAGTADERRGRRAMAPSACHRNRDRSFV